MKSFNEFHFWCTCSSLQLGGYQGLCSPRRRQRDLHREAGDPVEHPQDNVRRETEARLRPRGIWARRWGPVEHPEDNMFAKKQTLFSEAYRLLKDKSSGRMNQIVIFLLWSKLIEIFRRCSPCTCSRGWGGRCKARGGSWGEFWLLVWVGHKGW